MFSYIYSQKQLKSLILLFVLSFMLGTCQRGSIQNMRYSLSEALRLAEQRKEGLSSDISISIVEASIVMNQDSQHHKLNISICIQNESETEVTLRQPDYLGVEDQFSNLELEFLVNGVIFDMVPDVFSDPNLVPLLISSENDFVPLLTGDCFKFDYSLIVTFRAVDNSGEVLNCQSPLAVSVIYRNDAIGPIDASQVQETLAADENNNFDWGTDLSEGVYIFDKNAWVGEVTSEAIPFVVCSDATN